MMGSPSRIRGLGLRLVLALWLAWTGLATLGCETVDAVDEFLDKHSKHSEPSGTPTKRSKKTGTASGPKNRIAKQPDVRCYNTFKTFKDNEGQAGEDMQWHHIVGQHEANERKFGRHDLNCTDNVIRIHQSIHGKISAHYASKSKDSNGKLVRDWQAEKSFDEQYQYGVEKLREHGIRP